MDIYQWQEKWVRAGKGLIFRHFSVNFLLLFAKRKINFVKRGCLTRRWRYIKIMKISPCPPPLVPLKVIIFHWNSVGNFQQYLGVVDISFFQFSWFFVGTYFRKFFDYCQNRENKFLRKVSFSENQFLWKSASIITGFSIQGGWGILFYLSPP